MQNFHLGAIDVGSNAIRLLITRVIVDEDRVDFQKVDLYRLPIRLGADVFHSKEITAENKTRLELAFESFRNIMKIHRVRSYAAVATSAMRDAKNGSDVAASIKKKTGLRLTVIDGETEANIISTYLIRDFMPDANNRRGGLLVIDVGGGSTELQLYRSDKPNERISKSFKIGTVRLLNHKVDPNTWEELRQWIMRNISLSLYRTIGTGGNINKLLKMSHKTSKQTLDYHWLQKQYATIRKMTYEERILSLRLNNDRADVIVPALEIFLFVMRHAQVEQIFVPKIGLTDGLIKSIYYDRLGFEL